MLRTTVEISFLGGVAQVRVGATGETGRPGPLIEHHAPETPLLESEDSQRFRKIEKLVEMLEADLITEAEFRRLKQDLIAPEPRHPPGS